MSNVYARYQHMPDAIAQATGVDEHQQTDIDMAKEALLVLESQHRGYGWMVESDVRQGILKIRLMSRIMPSAAWYIIHLDGVTNANDMRNAVKKAGGEILERYRLRRAGIWLPEYQDVKHHFPKVQSAYAKVPE